jgi:hypothetical protein
LSYHWPDYIRHIHAFSPIERHISALAQVNGKAGGETRDAVYSPSLRQPLR